MQLLFLCVNFAICRLSMAYCSLQHIHRLHAYVWFVCSLHMCIVHTLCTWHNNNSMQLKRMLHICNLHMFCICATCICVKAMLFNFSGKPVNENELRDLNGISVFQNSSNPGLAMWQQTLYSALNSTSCQSGKNFETHKYTCKVGESSRIQ